LWLGTTWYYEVPATPSKEGCNRVDAGKMGHYVVPSGLKKLSEGHHAGKERHYLELAGQLVQPLSGRQAGKKGRYWVTAGQWKKLASGREVGEQGRCVLLAREMERLAG
jgi:hypothetical protein